MRILSVTAEMYPFVKTGGLADVAGSLLKALEKFGVRARTIIPGYPSVFDAIKQATVVGSYANLFGTPARLLLARALGFDLLVVDAPAFFDRPGRPYHATDGMDHDDNWRRFAALSWVAADIAQRGIGDWRPSLVHAHDWHAALSLVYLRYGARPDIPRLLTLHNIAFQGRFPARCFGELGLPDDAYEVDCLEYYGDLNYLKAGILSADAISVVSPTYAREILSPQGGMGLEGVLNARVEDITGIINGIDMDVWNPVTDPYIEHHYSARSLQRRAGNRKNLLKKFGLEPRHGPVFSSVNRLTWQKGMDILADVVGDIVGRGGTLIVLGEGDAAIEQRFREIAKEYPRSVAVEIGYDESLAHQIHAGADAMLVPSRFEPCGLTQLYALHYGCIPIVSRTGGLSETIIDANDAALHARAATGIQFSPVEPVELRHALHRAFRIYRRERLWGQLCRQAMKTDCSWARSAAQYAELYGRLIDGRHHLQASA